MWILYINDLFQIYFQATPIPVPESVASGQQNYLCPLCSKVLGSVASFQKHMDIHQGLYRYQCMVCQKGFSVKSNLDDHMRHHTGERLTCEGCRRQFIAKRRYIEHRKICGMLTRGAVPGAMMST